MIFNLRKLKGTYKGLIGELLFKLSNKKAVLTFFIGKKKFFDVFSEELSKLTKDQLNFLKKYFYSIDAIELKNNKIILYEIKTRNWYKKRLEGIKSKIELTKATYRIYSKALELGFSVKLVIIRLFDNWRYAVCIKDFNKKYFYIAKPKKYDRKDLDIGFKK